MDSQLLLRYSNKSNLSFKHCAIITHRNKIISIGYNTYLQYPAGKLFSIHAEINAIRRIPIDYKHGRHTLKMYIIRLNEDTNTRYNSPFSFSFPCELCRQKIDKERNIKTVIYS